MDKKTEFSKPKDLKNWAYETIKKWILNFDLESGKQIHIESIAAKLGTSRTPIREALVKLESEGLVKAIPRVGFFVTEVTAQDLKKLLELRELLEGYAAEKAAPFFNEEDIKLLAKLQKQSVESVEQGNFTKFLEIEVAIHSSIIEHSQNSYLLRIIDSLKDLTYRERLLSVRSIENVRESLNEHKEIIEALRLRNGKLAGQSMRKHINRVQKRILLMMGKKDV
jgi:DNA-binding GntR family transcriptional regulator